MGENVNRYHSGWKILSKETMSVKSLLEKLVYIQIILVLHFRLNRLM